MDDSHNVFVIIISTILISSLCLMVAFITPQFLTSITASAVDQSNIDNYNYLDVYMSPLSFLIPSEKTFAQNESYLKQKVDGLANFDQFNHNRGIDFSKCYARDSHELYDAIASDTHYVKIRGETPDESLKTISLPCIMLNAGFSIPDPKQLYVSEFRQVSPDEYKMWIITKEPAVETIDGALESTCRVSYYY